MPTNNKTWAPESPEAWANVLGMVVTPLLDPTTAATDALKHSALLDGDPGSFSLSVSSETDGDRTHKDLPSWIWSSHLRHSIVVCRARNRLVIRRWDRPDVEFRPALPKTGQEAIELHRHLEQSSFPTLPDVISFVMRTFRAIRDIARDHPSEHSIRLLNILLLAADLVRNGTITRDEFAACSRIRELTALLDDTKPEVEESVAHLPSPLSNAEVGILPQFLIDPEPRSGLCLFPCLLFRHAATALYQEAHLDLERDPQWSFPGMGLAMGRTDSLPRDVRFTPTNLARFLAEAAINQIELAVSSRRTLTVLDPACGSGVFLVEAVRALIDCGFRGTLRVVGYDVSPVSVVIARFCLHAFAREAAHENVDLTINILEFDALARDWENADIVLMNPPFISIDRMTAPQQSLAREILGPLAKGRFDIAMAFVWKALASLKQGASLASVIPASLLSSDSGAPWRDALRQELNLALVGRFDGFRFFRSSLVEPAFVVLKKAADPASDATSSIRVIIAREGHEDMALRASRLNALDDESQRSAFSVFVVPADAFERKWRARDRASYRLQQLVTGAGYPTVGDFFDVKQGVLTGKNDVFLLSAEAYAQLPKKEQRLFRPVAGQGTIIDGVLSLEEYLFYPHEPAGSLIKSDEDLRRLVPRYYQQWLKGVQPALKSRRGREREWWDLSEPRRTWQVHRRPRVLTTYFGQSGSFTYDARGDLVVVQGYAWLWRRSMLPKNAGDPQQFMHGTPLPAAFVALLNSKVFEGVLGLYATRVQGGQFNLSKRYVSQVPLPDLASMARRQESVVDELAKAGREVLSMGAAHILDRVNELAGMAYGFPSNLVAELCGVAIYETK